MAHQSPQRRDQPLRTWLPKVVLTFLVFLTLLFVVYQTTVGLDRDLGPNNRWVLIVALVLLVLLPVVDRVEEIRISPTGFEARLGETKAQALATVDQIENSEAAQAARGQIIQAKNPDQVKAAVKMAVELNVSQVLETVKQAIRQRRKTYVRYKPDPEAPTETYLVAPLDVKPGKTPRTRANDYLWVYSYEHQNVISLRLGRVMGVEVSEETFDPTELMADWKDKEPEWNIPREW